MPTPRLSVAATVRDYPRTLPYGNMKDAVLGRSYELSVVFVGATRARRLNREFRGKDYAPDILSFPLTDASGEIYLCPAAITRQAPRYGQSARNFTAFLLIHGMLHLKGHTHGGRMTQAEQTFCRRFGIRHPLAT